MMDVITTLKNGLLTIAVIIIGVWLMKGFRNANTPINQPTQIQQSK